MSTVRTRFAPSPTGFLHIGGVRTALYAYAWAKKNNGKFVLRIEDTDVKRFVEGSIEEIFIAFDLLGLNIDESINHGGEYGPYIQSERKEIYMKYAKQLIDSGNAYYCFLEGEELENLKSEFKGKGFRSPYRDVETSKSLEMIKNGKPFTIRLKVPNNETIIHNDGLQGRIEFDSNIVSDEVLIKSNGLPSYHLAVVVDDYLMKISHVFRAIEWLPSSPKQVLIHRFLNLEMPPYYHLPVILDPEGGKLSKRKGNVSTKEFLREGYLSEALLNFLMLLGWSAPIDRVFGEKEREIFSLSEFVELFDLKDLNNSNAIFNKEKLLWFNKEYIKTINNLDKKFTEWLKYFYSDIDIYSKVLDDKDLLNKLNLSKERSATLIELLDSIRFYYTAPVNINWDNEKVKEYKEKILDIIKDIIKILESYSEDVTTWNQETWVNDMKELSKKYNLKGGDSFMVLRMCIVGSPFSPPLFEAMQLLSKHEILERLKSALN